MYVDKTAYVFKLAQSGLPTLFSRPRRFGKSLLVSTLRSYFEGRRDLFEGLALERLEEEAAVEEAREAWQARSVFLLSFNGADYTVPGGLEDKLDALLLDLEERWGSPPHDLRPGPRL